METYREYLGNLNAPDLSLEDSPDILRIMNAWRWKTVDTVLYVVAVFGFVSILSLFISSVGEPKKLPTNLFFLATYLVLLAIVLYKNLPWRVRAWLLLLIIYVVGIISLARGGLAGAGREYLIIIPILATILIGARAGTATAMASLFVMVIFTFIVNTGVLQDVMIYQFNPVDFASWAEEIAYTVVMMGVVTTLVILFDHYLLRMLLGERQASQNLERAHARLEEYSQSLEQKVRERTAELAQTTERMEKELELAGRIQFSFMAKELPQLYGWQRAASLTPASQTFGDFYDIYPLGQDRYGILVADVVDKGMGAALFMALCWALVHTYSTQHPERPDLVMQKVNNRLFRYTHSDQFVTLFYGVFDPKKRTLSYCNAGHPPPYRFSQGESQPAEGLEQTGVALGMFPKKSWEMRKTLFEPGDYLVLYTDGVTEAVNEHQEFFGSEGLVRIVRENLGKSARDVHEAVIRRLGEFAGGLTKCDDVTCMVLACEKGLQAERRSTQA